MQYIPRIVGKELIDLYELLEFYIKLRYKEIDLDTIIAIRTVLKAIEAEYEDSKYSDKTIQEARKNHAGRRPIYSDENKKKILELNEQGYSKAKIAEMTGCTTGRVYGVLKKEQQRNTKLKLDDEFWLIIDNLIEKKNNREDEKSTIDLECRE